MHSLSDKVVHAEVSLVNKPKILLFDLAEIVAEPPTVARVQTTQLEWANCGMLHHCHLQQTQSGLTGNGQGS